MGGLANWGLEGSRANSGQEMSLQLVSAAGFCGLGSGEIFGLLPSVWIL